jgi:hypothetical protein
MKIHWLLAVLILVVFISGCTSDGGTGVTTVARKLDDNALKMDVKIQEKLENRRILPGSTIRMVVTLTNQVENETKGVYLRITNPYGIQISKVDCGSNCTCEWNSAQPSNPIRSSKCGGVYPVDCDYNGCHYDSIQSQDEEEITFGLKIPTEEQISQMGRDLKPEILLEYDYSGTSTLYIPIYNYGEKPAEPKKNFAQTTGPIHVSIDSDNWVRAGDLFPIYLDVKDVVNPSEKFTIDKEKFTLFKDHAQIDEKTIGRCDFDPTTYTHPKENVTLPLANPLVCTLKADVPTVPMIKAPIIIDYSYTYKVERIETITVQKAFLGIF